MTPLPLLPRALVLVLLVATTGGCVSASSNPIRTGQAKFKHDRAVHYDLTEPRTAQELGVPVGETSAIFSRGSGDPLWDIRFDLPGGKTFQTKGFGVGVDVEGTGAGAFNQVGVNTSAETTTDMDAALSNAVTLLGIKASEVAIWDRELGGYPLSNVHATDNFVFHGPPIGYLSVEVEARVEKGSPGAEINYMFSWGPGTTFMRPSDSAAEPSASG